LIDVLGAFANDRRYLAEEFNDLVLGQLPLSDADAGSDLLMNSFVEHGQLEQMNAARQLLSGVWHVVAEIRVEVTHGDVSVVSYQLFEGKGIRYWNWFRNNLHWWFWLCFDWSFWSFLLE
jgi:hypothetical protein